MCQKAAGSLIKEPSQPRVTLIDTSVSPNQLLQPVIWVHTQDSVAALAYIHPD